MKIDQLIEELQQVRKEHGNIEVTCTGSVLESTELGDVFETTVENLIVTKNHPRHGTVVRLWM